MGFWTCELNETTRAFNSMEQARDYAIGQLTINDSPPWHLVGSTNIHFLYNSKQHARLQPLRLAFADNPNGHVIIITGGPET